MYLAFISNTVVFWCHELDDSRSDAIEQFASGVGVMNSRISPIASGPLNNRKHATSVVDLTP